MLKLWIFTAFFTMLLTIVFTDDFIALSYPDAVILEASEAALPLKQIKYVLRAIVGEDASVNGEFPSLKISNIFAIPKLGFLMTVKLDNSVDYSALGTIVKYSIQGRTPGANLRNIINFEKFYVTDTLTKNSVDTEFHHLAKKLRKSKITEAKALIEEVRTLLTSDAVEKITVDIKTTNFVAIHLFNENADLDFGKLVGSINKLKDILKDIFFGILTYGGDTEPPSDQNISSTTTIDPMEFRLHSIAPLYDEDYAVIFNIILWFMIAFSFSLLAGILALGNMDPGRDTIIYRMTTARAKKVP